MAKALGYANTRDVIKKHVDAMDHIVLTENKKSQNATVNFQNYGNVFINESGPVQPDPRKQAVRDHVNDKDKLVAKVAQLKTSWQTFRPMAQRSLTNPVYSA